MLARPEQLDRTPRLLPLLIVLMVSLALWACILFGVFTVLKLL